VTRHVQEQARRASDSARSPRIFIDCSRPTGTLEQITITHVDLILADSKNNSSILIKKKNTYDCNGL